MDELDLNQLKAIVREAAGKLPKLKTDTSEHLFTLSLALTAAIKKTLFERSETKFSQEPVIEKKPIIQFVKRMRIDALEKFNQTSVFSAVHFYVDEGADKSRPCGVIIIYVEQKFVPELLRLLKYPYVDYDDDNEVKDGCGAILNLIAGQFKKEISGLGYVDLEMSYFKSFINTAADGIEFPSDQNQKYEISFHIDGAKRIVIEMVMSVIDKNK